MKIRAYLAAIPVMACALFPLNVPAQLKFAFTFTGTCISNNVNGFFTTTTVTSRNWLLDWASSHGVSNLGSIGLVYHLGESELGDAIEVVDARTGAVLDRLFLLYFGESADLGRSGLTNSTGTQIARLEYVYTGQNGHSMGSALLMERAALAADGSLANAVIQGRMQYTFLADSTHNQQMCFGTLTTGRQVTFPGQ